MNSCDDKARAATLALLESRAPDATVCPSEVARGLASESGCEDWRMFMPAVHAAVDDLLRHETVRLSWKGIRLETRSGPYRIARHG